MEKNNKKKCYIYIRVSTSMQVEGYSLEAQREYYEKRILSTPGWEFVGIYADEASGRNNRKMRDCPVFFCYDQMSSGPQKVQVSGSDVKEEIVAVAFCSLKTTLFPSPG